MITAELKQQEAEQKTFEMQQQEMKFGGQAGGQAGPQKENPRVTRENGEDRPNQENIKRLPERPIATKQASAVPTDFDISSRDIQAFIAHSHLKLQKRIEKQIEKLENEIR